MKQTSIIAQLLHSKEEENKQVEEWNKTDMDYPEEKRIEELIKEEGKKNPKRVAIKEMGGKGYSYEEIEKKSEEIANNLRRAGVEERDRVLIYAKENIDIILNIIGILKIGGIFIIGSPIEEVDIEAVDIDALWRKIKCDYMRAGARKGGLEKIEESKIVKMGEIKEEGVGNKKEERQKVKKITAKDIAYIEYEEIKGGIKLIPISHRSIINAIYGRKQVIQREQKAKVGIFYTLESMEGILEVMWGLMIGAEIVIEEEHKEWEGKRIVEEIKKEEITCLVCPAKVYKKVMEAGEEGGLDKLDTVIINNMIRENIIKEHNKICRGINLYGWYGVKEVTLWNSIKKLSGKKNEVEVIGRPMGNIKIYVLNKERMLVPIGVKGEIYIGGTGLYECDTEEDENIINNPYKEGERLYKTGDMGRYGEDGNIEYMGQIKRIIDYRGNQIQLEQIERVIKEVRGVNEVIVEVHKKDSKKQEKESLIAYIELDEGEEEKSIEEIKREIGKRLPKYMIPEIIKYVKKIKITQSGEASSEGLESVVDYKEEKEREKTNIEEILIKIWCEILQLEKIGLKDNFFEIGGDSILSIQLVSYARQEGIEMNMEQVFEAPTIEELAQMVEVKSTSKKRVQVEKTEKVSLSPIQYWFINQGNENINYYNQAILLEIEEGEIDEEALERSIQQVCKVHNGLRIRFREREGGGIEQYYEEYKETKESKEGIFRIEEIEGGEEERIRVCEEVQKSLEIKKGPIIQGAIIRDKDKRDEIIIVCHHLVVDRVSWNIIIGDLERYYKIAKEGRELPKEEEEYSYRRWVEELKEIVKKEEYKEEIGYWEKELGRGGEIPKDKEWEGSNKVKDMEEEKISLGEEETRRLIQEVPKGYKTQINDVLLTALGRVIAEWKGEREVGIMLEGHGRRATNRKYGPSKNGGMVYIVISSSIRNK